MGGGLPVLYTHPLPVNNPSRHAAEMGYAVTAGSDHPGGANVFSRTDVFNLSGFGSPEHLESDRIQEWWRGRLIVSLLTLLVPLAWDHQRARSEFHADGPYVARRTGCLASRGRWINVRLPVRPRSISKPLASVQQFAQATLPPQSKRIDATPLSSADLPCRSADLQRFAIAWRAEKGGQAPGRASFRRE